MSARQQFGTGDTFAGAIEARLDRLETHLDHENPILLQIVKSFRQLDKVAYRLGLLTRSQSFATLVPWWPLISVVGTFSSGKSTFINHYLGEELQRTGNQAVDDKFTVICFSSDEVSRTLPGLALDSDPRFPFYQISQDIEQVESGEGNRVDAYIQLKTCPSQALRGKIFIDSPGFDADEQRTSVLRITDHILSLSDLVLVLFDARHPEPGAMQDTLEHLVAKTIKRPDSGKFLYILNQVDSTAREDNPEEVYAAWQRALAQKGLTAGRFYRIYDPQAAIPIESEEIRNRFEAKRAADMAEIVQRIEQVEVERAYRIIGVLEKTAKAIENDLVPKIRAANEKWKLRVLWVDGIVFGLIGVGFLGWTLSAGYWQGLRFAPPWLEALTGKGVVLSLTVGSIVLGVLCLHFYLRRLAANTVVWNIRRDKGFGEGRDWTIQAFLKNVRVWRPFFLSRPAGWHVFTRKRIARILSDADRYVQTLNNRFTNPSGTSGDGGTAPRPEEAGDPAAIPMPSETPAVGGPEGDSETKEPRKTGLGTAGWEA